MTCNQQQAQPVQQQPTQPQPTQAQVQQQVQPIQHQPMHSPPPLDLIPPASVIQFQAVNQSSPQVAVENEEFELGNQSDENELIIDVGENSFTPPDEDIQETPVTENVAPQKEDFDEILEKLNNNCTDTQPMDTINFNFVVRDIATIHKVIQSDSLTERIFRTKINVDVFNRKFVHFNSYI